MAWYVLEEYEWRAPYSPWVHSKCLITYNLNILKIQLAQINIINPHKS